MPLQFSSLASGSSGNCQLIMSDNTILLLDAGLTGKYIVNALSHYNVGLERVDGILVTHEHSDHISGVGVLHRKAQVPLYVSAPTWQAIKDRIGKVDASRLHIIDNSTAIQIKDIAVMPYRISHDAVDPLCFTFEHKASKLAIVTDLGTIDDALISAISDANLIMLEANHNVEMLMTGKYPYPLKRRVAGDKGHLSNEVCAQAAIEAVKRGKASTILLAHLSRENNTPQLAYETVKSAMSEVDMQIGRDVIVDLTYRNRTGNLYRIDG